MQNLQEYYNYFVSLINYSHYWECLYF